MKWRTLGEISKAPQNLADKIREDSERGGREIADKIFDRLKYGTGKASSAGESSSSTPLFEASLFSISMAFGLSLFSGFIWGDFIQAKFEMEPKPPFWILLSMPVLVFLWLSPSKPKILRYLILAVFLWFSPKKFAHEIDLSKYEAINLESGLIEHTTYTYNNKFFVAPNIEKNIKASYCFKIKDLLHRSKIKSYRSLSDEKKQDLVDDWESVKKDITRQLIKISR